MSFTSTGLMTQQMNKASARLPQEAGAANINQLSSFVSQIQIRPKSNRAEKKLKKKIKADISDQVYQVELMSPSEYESILLPEEKSFLQREELRMKIGRMYKRTKNPIQSGENNSSEDEDNISMDVINKYINGAPDKKANGPLQQTEQGKMVAHDVDESSEEDEKRGKDHHSTLFQLGRFEQNIEMDSSWSELEGVLASDMETLIQTPSAKESNHNLKKPSLLSYHHGEDLQEKILEDLIKYPRKYWPEEQLFQFDVPMNISALDTMSGLEYLASFVKVRSESFGLVLKKVFQLFSHRRCPHLLPAKNLLTAIEFAFGIKFAGLWEEICQVLPLAHLSFVNEKHFIGIVALIHRIFQSKTQRSNGGGKFSLEHLDVVSIFLKINSSSKTNRSDLKGMFQLLIDGWVSDEFQYRMCLHVQAVEAELRT